VHVLHVNQFYWPHDRGGSGISTRELAEAQAAAGDRVTVLAEAPGSEDAHRSHRGVDVIYTGRSRATRGGSGLFGRAAGQLWPELDPGLPGRLRRLLAGLRPDLVHTHVVAATSTRIWPLARALGIPAVHTLHDYYLVCARGTLLRGERRCGSVCADCRIATRARRRHAAVLDAVIGVSAFVVERHLSAGALTAVPRRRVIGNGVAVSAQPRPQSPGGLRLGYLGRLHPSKGLELLVDAVRELADPTVSVAIGGRGPADYLRDLESRARGLAVRFAGYVEPGPFLSGIDALVVSSRFEEPFGRIIIEAWGQGVPVICARRGGAQDLVDEGETGWLFEPDTPGALTAVLRRCAADGVSAAMRARCRARAAEFSPEAARLAHSALYAEVLGAAGAAA